jgi:signal transduction histidine kinase
MSADWQEMRNLVGKAFIADTQRPSRTWFDEYIHPDDQSSVRAAIDAAIRAKSALELEHRVIRPDGTLGWVFSRAIPLISRDAQIVEWFGAAKDVTERKRIEEQMREADRRKDEFLAILAHELRNPLAPLANATQLLRAVRKDDSICKQACAIIERQTAALSRLVDDLLDIARISTGRLRLRLERVALRTVMEQAADAARPLIEQRRQTLRLELIAEPSDIFADPARLQQILVNLLNNAAKYTDEGGSIKLSATEEDRWIVIRVEDTGIGIEPELLPRLFQSFTQGSRSLERSQGGLGVGLSVVRSLVEMHGGRVEVRSTVGQGSEFTVRIPASPEGH